MHTENKDWEDAESMQLKTMEKLGKTKKQKLVDNEASKPLKRPSSSSDAAKYMQKKSAVDI